MNREKDTPRYAARFMYQTKATVHYFDSNQNPSNLKWIEWHKSIWNLFTVKTFRFIEFSTRSLQKHNQNKRGISEIANNQFPPNFFRFCLQVSDAFRFSSSSWAVYPLQKSRDLIIIIALNYFLRISKQNERNERSEKDG